MTESAWLTRDSGTPGRAMSACIRAAIAAPSIHNSQPWLFRPHGTAVDVLVDRRRHLNVADPDGREMHVSVGAALFNLRIAMLAEGRQPLVRLLADPDEPDLAATVMVGPAVRAPADIRALAEAIHRRQCACRISRPRSSSGMLILVEDASESVSAADVEVSDPSYVCDRCGDSS